MLIDARHREETRVAVVKGHRIEEFDFESAERKQLKGNIYLAKVTRVEPSLQAAFVDYGGNRHGFLAFSEIHPDYYQIPKEDRDALLAEEAEHAAQEAALRAEEEVDEEDGAEGEVEVLERLSDEDEEAEDGGEEEDGEDAEASGNKKRRRGKKKDSAADELRKRRMDLRRRYKIQDVIRRRQVLLVQVVKEERGNKGAALTTYLSLAGRYCVLMPNTAHGGGISRKISNAGDRKRLKTIMSELKLPPTMGCIVRTAGLQRTKTEIKRDFDYLARLWDEIREGTLKATAPALIYGDSDLIKRAIRDIYNREIEEVIVEGEEGYRQAKDFMKLLMPSHARRVKQYADAVPLFQRSHVEDQLSAMYHPVVQLKSGGYLVINPTEALVSIDINSGRSTREHNIEQTATATNLEAAQEIARQLRLRDMAGLVVIDFIDMDHSSNVRKVEKAMKEALKNDRARIQVGRISAFGLMEMSRQRLRTGVLEASTVTCSHCEGTGLVRTASSAGLSALRLIEDEAARGRGSQLTLRSSQEAAFYVLNKKRADIAEIEERYGVSVEITSDGELEGARMSVEASGPPPAHAPRFEKLAEEPEEEILDIEEDETEEEEAQQGSDDGSRKRRRRRRGRRGRTRTNDQAIDQETDDNGDEGDASENGEGDTAEADDTENEASDENGEGAPRKRRRRGRRGGRRSNGSGETTEESNADSEPTQDATAEPEPTVDATPQPVAESAETTEAETPAEEKPKRRRRPKARPAAETEAGDAAQATPTDAAPAEAETETPAAETEAPAKPKRTRRKKADPAAENADESPAAAAEPEAPAKPKRTRRKKPEPAAGPAETGTAEPAEAAKPEPAETASEPAPAPAEPVVEEAAPEPAPEAPATPAQPEPVAAQAEQGAEDDSGEPPRRGWWQRTFGA
ncbi:Rne/Rng family ribonuclease [Sphingosinithalassobacter tenebrarum]|uniref:Ribonuclease E n=2 Tax=Stakelama tenebrarum TaxID=2711215 RepID=A0A6G6Y9T7_9SPHN|nr:Rne/Rng family ribonuclease [Sphingosinithalassobacter tenebrarum]